MKNKRIYVGLLVALTLGRLPAVAQMDHGAFFSYFGGGTYTYNPNLQSELKSPDAVGGNVNLNGVTMVNGGSFDILYSGGLIFGGNGYGYNLVTGGTNANIKDKLGAGILDFGYSFSKKKKHLSYPYVGVGGFGTKFTVTNKTSESISIDENYLIKPTKFATFSTGGLAFEAGYSYKYYAFKGDRKGRHRFGPMVGLDAGCQYYLALGKWRDIAYRNILVDYNRPLILSPYVRISIGIGAFSTKRRDR